MTFTPSSLLYAVGLSATIVAHCSHRIPQYGGILPLINQSGSVSQKQKGWFCLSGSQILFPHVRVLKFDDASRLLLCGCCFAAPLWSFYQDCSKRIKVVLQQ